MREFDDSDDYLLSQSGIVMSKPPTSEVKSSAGAVMIRVPAGS